MYIVEVNKMKAEDVKIDREKKQGEKASVQINIRIMPTLSEWLKEKGFSPTAIFLEACKELGFKKPKGE